MPPVQAGAQPEAIGPKSLLTHQVMWDLRVQSPSIPTMLSIFPTVMSQMAASSMPPVQADAQPKTIGT